MEAPIDKPRPRPTPVAVPFWAGLADEKIVMQRCGSCDRWVFYPRNRCPSCLSADLTWHDVDPRGTVYAVSVARQPTAPPFADETPQVLAIVELANGVRLSTTLVDVDPDTTELGQPVVARFDHGDDGLTLLRFAPAGPR